MSNAECAMCDEVDRLLKPCNSSLGMDRWSSKFVYRPEQLQAPCACNENYYQLVERCMDCQTSTTATYSVVNRTFYGGICQSYGVQYTDFYVPPASSTTTSLTPLPTNSSLPSTGGQGQSSHSSLSSGAIAGIVVSIVALIVALSVAGYVYARRKKEREQREADEMYKYSEDQRNSYMEVPLPQYTGMIQPTLPPLPNITNLRVTNPDAEDDDMMRNSANHQQQYHPDPSFHHEHQPSFEVKRNSSPGWRRGSFDDD